MLLSETFTGSGKVKGDFWYEGPLCEAWKEGYMITVNATLIYKIDVVARQVCMHYVITDSGTVLLSG